MLYMFLLTATKHQDIIDVGEAIRQISKDRIHHPLEGVPCIPESEWHAQELKHPEWCDDRCLADVFLGHGNLIIPFLQIQLGEDCPS